MSGRNEELTTYNNLVHTCAPCAFPVPQLAATATITITKTSLLLAPLLRSCSVTDPRGQSVCACGWPLLWALHTCRRMSASFLLSGQDTDTVHIATSSTQAGGVPEERADPPRRHSPLGPEYRARALVDLHQHPPQVQGPYGWTRARTRTSQTQCFQGEKLRFVQV